MAVAGCRRFFASLPIRAPPGVRRTCLLKHVRQTEIELGPGCYNEVAMSHSPAPEPPGNPVDSAFAAYLKSIDSGEFEGRDEFLARFPEIAVELSELLEAADRLHQFTLAGRSSAADFAEFSHADAAEGSDAERRQRAMAETIAGPAVADPSAAATADPEVTLPMANRGQGDPGPTLPYDLGDYLLLKVIGRGGMGIVYLARQRALDRYVAVKMIRSGILADDAEVRRFYTEAQAAARLRHRGIVAVHQFGRRAGHHFFSMEYIRGSDLQQRINAGQLDPDQAARYVRDVALAIAHAHDQGVLHRDLKPANVLIDERDQVHVTDFGLAKHLDAESSVTGSGTAVGTPHYMAPEQAEGHSDGVTVATDVYSLGAVLFASLTGRPPLVGDNVVQTLLSVVHQPAPAVRSFRPEVSRDLDTIVAKCLEKDPSRRYASAAQLAQELDAYLDRRPIAARPRNRAVKLWHWLEGVPLVGALRGRRVLHSSATHRRFQAVMLLLMLGLPVAAGLGLLVWQRQSQAMPDRVRFAGGIQDGVYTEVSSDLAKRLQSRYPVQVHVVPSAGSLENRDRLLRGEIDLAPMQATAISGDRLSVVAPLFYELLHVVVRADSEIASLADLPGHDVMVGPAGSGSHVTAELVLETLGFSTAEVGRRVAPWSELFAEHPPQVAMVCVGRGSRLVSRLLENAAYRLIEIPNAIQISLQHPMLRPMAIEPGDLPGAGLPVGGVATVGTTGFLAADLNAPAALITAVLEELYRPPPVCGGLIPQHQAAEWQGWVFHPAARRFYSRAELTSP